MGSPQSIFGTILRGNVSRALRRMTAAQNVAIEALRQMKRGDFVESEAPAYFGNIIGKTIEATGDLNAAIDTIRSQHHKNVPKTIQGEIDALRGAIEDAQVLIAELEKERDDDTT